MNADKKVQKLLAPVDEIDCAAVGWFEDGVGCPAYGNAVRGKEAEVAGGESGKVVNDG